MNNCLVTKLKSTVNDNSLLKFGEMIIDVTKQDSPTNITNCLRIGNGGIEDLIIETENGEQNLTFDKNMESGWTNKLTLPKSSPDKPIFVRNGDYRIRVVSKYTIIYLGGIDSSEDLAISVDTKQLEFSNNIKKLGCLLTGDIANISGLVKLDLLTLYHADGLTGDISSIAPLTSLETLFLIEGQKLKGNISSLASLTKLRILRIRDGYSLEGDISSLAPLASLDMLEISACNKIKGNIASLSQPLTFMNLSYTGISGELIDFVVTQRANGRTTGNCRTDYWGNNITFNGSIPSTSQVNLSWTENTITLGDVTVNQ